MDLDTSDKTFNKIIKTIGWIVGGVTTIITMTYAIAMFITSKIEKTVQTSVQLAVAEIVYEMKDFKEIKAAVIDQGKQLSLLQYRIGNMEDKSIRPYMSKEFEKPEETEPVTVKKEKNKES